MKVIVTGAAGLIGSHLVDKLLKNTPQDSLLENLSCKNALKVANICANIFDN